MSTLTEEIAKLRDLSDSLRAEVSELRQNAENLAREKTTVTEELKASNSELSCLQLAFDQLTQQHEQLTKNTTQLSQKSSELDQSLKDALAGKAALEENLAASNATQTELSVALALLRDSQAEVDKLRNKLRQLEAVSSLTELKEENAMLEEKVSQLEEQLSQLEEERTGGKGLLKEQHVGQLRSLAEDHLLEKSKLR